MSHKATILMLTNSAGGLCHFRFELVERLLSEGYSVFFSVPNNSEDIYVKKLKEIGAQHIFTKINRRSTNPFIDILLFFKYIKLLKKIKFDIVLTYTIKPNVYGGIACNILKIPYIANITGLGSAVENKSILQNISLFLYKIAFKKVKHVFFQNSENQEFFFKNNIAIHNNYLLPGSGVNLKKFDILDYPIESECIKFLFISRVMREKGIDYYLEAAKYLKSKNPNFEFHICGACDDSYQNIIKASTKDGIIIYHGRVPNVRDYLKFTHCTIHPTYYPEGMSNVLLESAASARPAITTNRSGCREIIKDGVNGYIAEQKNSRNLIEKIEKFIGLSYEEKKQMGLNGRKMVEDKFDRNIVIDAYMKTIKNILSGN
ncbi:MAG: glycosyltransferase family 4 protein [Spirochaetes bacterium]|nr:glycosyltransferase family 4 protein [Spirochaetota bacterium]